MASRGQPVELWRSLALEREKVFEYILALVHIYQLYR